MSSSSGVSKPVGFLGISEEEFFTKFRSLADVRSHVELMIRKPDRFGIPPKATERAVDWLTDFQRYKFEEEPLNLFPQTKYYRYCGMTVPVHSPLESLAYALSLVEPPNDAAKTNWYEIWAVCIARLIGIASPEQAPVTVSLLYPSPWFELPTAWDSKYLVGTSISLRLVDHLGQLIPNKDEADDKREVVRRERCEFALRCGSMGPEQSSDELYFESKNAFQQLIGLCAQHMPSCIILKTIPAQNATHFKRLAVNVDPITKKQNISVERQSDWKPFFKDTCINCIDGHCNPAGFAASKSSRTKLHSS